MLCCLIRSCLVVLPTAVADVTAVTVDPRYRSFSGLPDVPVATLGFALARAAHCVSFPRAPGRAIKPRRRRSFFFLPSVFPTPPLQLRRALLSSSEQASLSKVVLQLRLLLANPFHQLWLSESTENSR